MRFRLPSHVHLAKVGEDLVFLDLRREAYLCVPNGLALRPSPDCGSLDPPTPEIAAELLAAELLVSASEAAVPARQPRAPLPAKGLQLTRAPMTGRDTVRLLGALFDLATRYPGRDLAAVIAAAAPVQDSQPEDDAEVLRLASVFERVAIWLPIPSKCVIRSFLLLRFLQRSGRGATWVFGVRTWPFAAHCWLQLGDVALDDAPERLQTYEPILAAPA